METFEFILAHLWAIISMEEKIDKKGKPFKSLRFSKERQKYHYWIKTLVVYEDIQKGVVKILINAGAVRYSDDKTFPVVKSYTLKKRVNEDGWISYTAYSGGKWLGSVPGRFVQDILDAKVPQSTLSAPEYKAPTEEQYSTYGDEMPF